MEPKLVEAIVPFFAEESTAEMESISYPALLEDEIERLILKGRAMQQALWEAGKPNRAIGEKALNFLLN